jgi:hypothetical protein
MTMVAAGFQRISVFSSAWAFYEPKLTTKHEPDITPLHVERVLAGRLPAQARQLQLET